MFIESLCVRHYLIYITMNYVKIVSLVGKVKQKKSPNINQKLANYYIKKTQVIVKKNKYGNYVLDGKQNEGRDFCLFCSWGIATRAKTAFEPRSYKNKTFV